MVIIPTTCFPAVLFLGAILPMPNFLFWAVFAVLTGFALPKVGISLGVILAVIAFLTTSFCVISGLGFTAANYETSTLGGFLAAGAVGVWFFIGVVIRVGSEFLLKIFGLEQLIPG